MDTDDPRIIRARIPLSQLTELAELRFGDMVKAAVDVDQCRPSQGKRSRSVDDPDLQARIRLIVQSLIDR